MAWISVHEQVLGGKLRSLAKKLNCSQNEALGLLVRFWLWGINNADEEGQIESATTEDVADVLNVGVDKRISPEDAVRAMVETRWIDFDSDRLYIHDWKEWQKQWYKALRIRSADNERKAKERAKNRREVRAATPTDSFSAAQTTKSDSKQSTESGQTTISPNDGKKLETGYSTEFEEFWAAYPRKVGKGEAYKCYKARLKDGWKPEELVVAAKNYSFRIRKERTEQQYVKHPKTFLSSSTPFTDFLTKHDGASVPHTDDDDPYADWRR